MTRESGIRGAARVPRNHFPNSGKATSMSDNTYAAAETVRAEGAGPGSEMLLQALYRSVTAEDVAAIGKAMIQKAKDGHFGAAKLIFAYVLGKPQRAAMDVPSARREVGRA